MPQWIATLKKIVFALFRYSYLLLAYLWNTFWRIVSSEEAGKLFRQCLTFPFHARQKIREALTSPAAEEWRQRYASWLFQAQGKAADIAASETAQEAKVKLRGLRYWWQYKYVTQINHEEVVNYVRSEGRMTSRYSFMVTMSCAIAVLGLLLSSPAVVIGAMLISPLMAPIVSLGFSLCLLDSKQMKKTLESLLCGIALSLVVAWLIVSLSPITDATPEIIARTRPNLFDLLVAIFSGMTGGYAVIKRKGETIVGVAIATALMPPLAVVGFGLATSNAAIAKGAFMLFMTNLLAISLTVALMAKFYGFRSQHSGKHTVWQFLLIAIVFGVLSLPLGVALKNIAYQTYITKVAKNTINEYFDAEHSRISVFNINFTPGEPTAIDTVVLTPSYKSKAQPDLKDLLSERTGSAINFSLDQVVVAGEVIKDAEPQPTSDNTISSTLPSSPPHASRMEEMTSALQQATFFPTEYIKVDIDNKLASIYPKPSKGVTITTLRQFEISLNTRYPGWTIKVVPPFRALPPVLYEMGADTPSQAEEEQLGDSIWALHRWDARKVEVVGFANTVGEFEQFNNSSLAYRRAMKVLAAVRAAGIEAEPRAEYRSRRQRKDEQQRGITSFQRVEIHILALPEEASSEEPAQNISEPTAQPPATTDEPAPSVDKTTEPTI